MWSRASNSQLVVALAAVGAVWLAACARWWWADAVVPWDSKNQFYAFFRFMAGELAAGRSPFWNPYHYGGHPAIADPQSLIFQPVFALWALVDATPSLFAFDFLVMAHLLVGALSMVALGHRRDWPAAASVLAGVVFMLGGAVSGRLNHTGIIIAYGLFPLAWLLLEIALQRRSYAYALGFALVAAVIVLGRNQVALMLACTLVALALREMLNAPSPPAWLKSRIVLLATMAAVIVAVIAVPMLLTLQLAALSNRPAVPLATALEASLYPANLASMAIANIYGQHSGDYLYWGPGAATLPAVAATDDSFNYLFVGAAPVILVLWFGVAGRRLLSSGMKAWTAIIALALLFSLGRYATLFPLVFEHLPGFAFFRRPIDGMFLVVIGVAYLSGALLADHVRRGLPKPDALWSAIMLAATCAALAGALTFSHHNGHGAAALVELARAAPVLLAITAGLALARSRPRREQLAAAVACVTAIELVVWNAASRLNAEDRPYYQVLDNATGEEARALAVLEADIARSHAEGRRPRVEIAGIDGPWQNLAMVRKLEATNGYNPLRIGIYDRFVAPGEIAAFLDERTFAATFPAYDSPLARALGLQYLVLARPIEDYANVQRLQRFTTLLAGPRVWIYRLPGAFARLRFTSQVEVGDVEALARDGNLAHPPSADRVMIDAATPPRAPYPAAPAGTAGTASIASWSPSRVAIEVTAVRAGVLVLADTYYPGWIARIDGRRVPILRADVLFRAVEVPAGRHSIVFTYRPLSPENLADAVRRISHRKK